MAATAPVGAFQDVGAMLKAGRSILSGRLYPNMDELPELSLGTVLANVENLYLQEQHEKPGAKKFSPMYSQVGPVLIALNPFCEMPCYGPEWQEAFRNEGAAGRISTAWQRLGPHCYATIEEVYQGLKHNPCHSVVICGESGAGKTVTNAKMLGYLLDFGSTGERARAESLSQKDAHRSSSFAADVEHRKLQLQASNELLEYFGNAKTTRNDNSSRFGKYSQLYFEGEPAIVCGLKIDHYLLERSRVVSIPNGERNYHIMHMLGAVERERLKQEGRQRTFQYLVGGEGVNKANGTKFEDAKMFEELTELMAEAGFDQEAQTALFDSIKGCLYLGDVDFVNDATGTGDAAAKLKSSCLEEFSEACRLLGVEEDRMKDALMSKVIAAQGETVHVEIDMHAARAQRDSMAKTLYSRCFDEIVEVINARLGNQLDYTEKPVVGLLDIFGFEDMPVNGFEQLFINLTNEWIQHHFNTVMFKRELEIYKEEEIDITFTRPDNWKCVELFISDKNPSGIIKLLQDRVTTPNAKDGKEFVDSMLNRNLKDVPHYSVCDPKSVQKLVQAKQQKFPKVKIQVRYEQCFQVAHYAGSVLYTVQDFIAKSKDQLSEHVLGALRSSRREQVASLFRKDTSEEQASSGKKDVKTVGQHFKFQLKGLMETLESSSSLFVRCIKPNSEMKPGRFDETLVLEQLTCGGVVSALEMRSAGLPDRVEFAAFFREFWCLERRQRVDKLALRERVKDVMERLVGPEDADPAVYRCGIKRIFMRSGILGLLRDILNFIISHSARIVQRKWRAKKGISLVTRMELANERLEQLRQTGAERSVDKSKSVRASICQVNATLETSKDRAQKDPATWDTVMTAKKSILMNLGLTKAQEQAAGRLTQVLQDRDLEKLEQLVHYAAEQTSKAVQRKDAAEARLGELLTQKKQEANEQLSRVLAIEQLCTGAEMDPGKQAILKECSAAKAHITGVIQEKLPALHKRALFELDIDDDDPEEVGLPDEADAMIKSGMELCQAAEGMAAALAEKKRRFEHEAVEGSPEGRELAQKRKEAKERLELLEGDSREAARDGLTMVAQALAEAYRLDEDIEDMRQKAEDPKLFLQAIRDFLVAEQAAQEAVHTMRRLESEARERELQNLQNIIVSFSKSKELQQVARTYIALLGEFREHIDVTAAEEQMKTQGLSTQEPTRVALGDRLQQAQSATEALGLEVVDVESRPDTTVLFHYNGPWSAECFKLLGQDVKPYEGMARVLDEGRFESVVDTVEALNAGVLGIEAGFCIGWSETWKQYYLLFQKDCREAALQAYKLSEAARKEKAAQEARSKFVGTVRNALGAEDRRKLEDSMAKQRQSMEDRIREVVNRELDESYRTHADEEIGKARLDIELKAETRISKALLEYEARAKEDIDKARSEIETKASSMVKQAHEEASQLQEQAMQLRLKAKEEVSKANDEIAKAHLQAREEVSKAHMKAHEEALRAQEDVIRARAQASEEAIKAQMKAQEEVSAARMKFQEETIKAQEEIARAQANAREESMKAQDEAAKERAKAKEDYLRAQDEMLKEKAKAQDEVATIRAQALEASLKAHEEILKAQAKAQEEAARAREEIAAAKAKAHDEYTKAYDELVRARTQAEHAVAKAHEEAALAQAQAKEEAAKAREEASKVLDAIAKERLKAQDELNLARAEAMGEVSKAHWKASEEAAKAHHEVAKAQDETARTRMEAEETVFKQKMQAAEEEVKQRIRVEEELAHERRKAEELEHARVDLERELKTEIHELQSQVRLLRAKDDASGELPHLCIGLGSCVYACDGLLRGLAELRGHLAAVGEDIGEAIQRTTALQHNPDTLPCLTDLAQAIARAQKSHLEVEVLGRELGLPEQAMCFLESREKLEQVIRRCRGLATHSFTAEFAAMETEYLNTDLSAAVGLLKRLKHGFDKWKSRVEAVHLLVQQAQAHLALNPEELGRLLEKRGDKEGDRRGSLLDRMMSGVKEAFCAVDRPSEEKADDGARLSGLRLDGARKSVGSKAAPGDQAEKATGVKFARAETQYSVVTDGEAMGARDTRDTLWTSGSTIMDPQTLELRGMLRSKKLQRKRDQPVYTGAAAQHRMRKRAEVLRTSIGDRIVVLPSRQLAGTVRFCGYTDFAAGEWMGVELDGAYGKNDGSVNGVYYFECEPFHGLFLRPNLVERVKPVEHTGADRRPSPPAVASARR